MTLKNNRVPLFYYIKVCASLQSHRWIQTRVTVRKRSIRIKIGHFLSHVTLKFDGWPRKTIGHLSYAASSFVHLFIAIGEFKLELQSGNAQFRSKLIFCPCDLEIWWMTLKNNRAPLYAVSSFVHHFIPIGEFKLELQSGNTQFVSNLTIFFSRVTLKFDGWPWKNNRAPFLYYIKLCIISNPSVKSNLSYSTETPNSGQNRQFFVPRDLEIWRMTLRNNRVPLLYYIKLRSSFHSHWWIQTGATVRKCPIWVKFNNLFSHVTLQFLRMTLETIGHLL